MSVRSSLLLALTAIAAITSRLPAQQGSPEQRVAQFFDALAGQRWREAANLIHPARLESFQDWQVSMLIGVSRRHAQYRQAGTTPTPGYYLDAQVDAELRAETLAVYSGASIGGLGKARTIGGASALPAVEFMQRWLAARAQDPDSLYRKRFAYAPRRLVGDVTENDSLAHVLYRVARSHQYTRDPADVEIMELRKHRGRWYLWPDPYNYDVRIGIEPFLRLQLPVNGDKGSGRN